MDKIKFKQKSVLEYPAKYGSKLAEDFEKYFNEIVEFTKIFWR